jgi:hypothetical protein
MTNNFGINLKLLVKSIVLELFVIKIPTKELELDMLDLKLHNK